MQKPDAQTAEKLAAALRQAVFPGALDWRSASDQVKEQWLRAAVHAEARIERARDEAFRMACALAHELGQHVAAKAIREIRFATEKADA